MTNYEEDLEALEDMETITSPSVFINWSEGGGGEVYLVNNMYILFEISRFGGSPQYVETYYKTEVEKMLKLVYSWT
jgi:hypothetical protein